MRSPLLAAVLLVSLILAVLIGMVLLLRETGSSAPIDSLPRDTGFLLRATDPAKLCRDLSHTRMIPLEEDETWDAFAALLALLLERHGIDFAPSAAEMAQALRRETIVAIVPGDAEEPSGIALVVDLGQAAAAVPEIARRFTHAALGPRGDLAWIARNHHGREYLTLHLPGGPGGLSVAGLKGLGIVSTSGAAVRRIVDTLDGRIEPLRSDPAYRATRDHLGKRGDLLGYLSGDWLRGLLDQRVAPGPERRALRLLGIEAVRGVGIEIDLPRQMFRERLFVSMQRDHRGLPGELFDAPPRAPDAARLMPAGFPFYLTFAFSGLGTVYRKLPEILSSAVGEERQAIRARLDGFSAFMAMDLDRDLFGALGNELVVGFGGASPLPRTAPNRSLLNTPAVAVITLRDRSAIRRVLQRVDGLARAMAAYHSVTRDKQLITSYGFATLAPLSPAYRLIGGRLIAATSPDLLADALDAGARQMSLADRSDLSSLTDRLPDRGHVYFLGDTARIADLLQGHLRFASPPGLLPEPLTETLARLARRSDLPSTAASARMTEGGLLLDCISPVSPSMLTSLWLASDGVDEGETSDGRTATPAGPFPY